jgi:type II secretory pathway component GspD/PulD (secretin)
MKGIRKWGLLGLGWLLLGAGGVLAEPADARGGLDERIDMTLKKAAPDDVFRSFAKMINAEAVVDPGVREPVSIELHNVRARTMLDTICESIGCRWSLEPGNPAKLRVTAVPNGGGGGGKPGAKPTAPGEPIDLRVTNANVQEVLKTFGDIANARADVDPTIKGTVSFNLENTPWNEALDAVCATAGCEWSLDGGVLRVTPRKKK